MAGVLAISIRGFLRRVCKRVFSCRVYTRGRVPKISVRLAISNGNGGTVGVPAGSRGLLAGTDDPDETGRHLVTSRERILRYVAEVIDTDQVSC